MLTHYIIPNLIVIVLSLIMIKKWGVEAIPTFVSASLLYICLFILKDKTIYPVYFIILFNSILLIPVSIFIFLSLKRQNNIQLLKEWKIWIPVVAGLFSSLVINFFIYDGIEAFLITLMVAPIYESLLFHEIVFNTVKDKYSKRTENCLFYCQSCIIAVLHGSLRVKDLLFRTLGFFILYLIKNSRRENSDFWLIVLIHFLINLICLILDLIKMGA